MLGRRRGGSSSSKSPEQPSNTGTAVAADTGQGASTGDGVSQFMMQLDASATERLQRMSQRLRLLEQQMETLETGVAKASRESYE